MDRALRAMCTDRVIVHKFLSRSGSGEMVWNSAQPLTLQAFISRKAKLIRRADGKEIVSEHTIILDATPTTLLLALEDLFIFADQRRLRAESIKVFRGEKNAEHIEVSF